MTTQYDKNYFDKRQQLTLSSANIIINLLREHLSPSSVIDVGCANGVWLSVFAGLGVTDIFGIDGPWVESDQLLIPESQFMSSDLSTQMPEVDRRYDLACCIEVIEYVPEDTGRKLVELLCKTADVVLFSAAVPYQGGTGHVNEQRQSYWMEHFDRNGFKGYDLIRNETWNNPEVNVIYKQNMFVYLNAAAEKQYPGFSKFAFAPGKPVDVIHPDLYEMRVSKLYQMRLDAKKPRSYFGRVRSWLKNLRTS